MRNTEQIIKPVKQELAECKALYEKTYCGGNAVLADILRYVHKGDGKMMRPILALLSARLSGNVGPSAIYAATAYEFFHNASLLHDDVVDDSDERRGMASVNSLYNNKKAVLVGDYMLAQGLECMAKAGNPRLVEIMSGAAQQLADGELLQLSIPEETRTEEQYIEIIRCKTAALFRACAQSGAIAAGAAETDVENMNVLGEAIGMCFQIKDDMLDGEIELHTASMLLARYIDKARTVLSSYEDSQVKESINLYIDFVVDRDH